MKINVWSKWNLKKRLGWFLILMIWVGMVTGVILHQTPSTNDHIAQVSSQEGYVEIDTNNINKKVKANARKKGENSLESVKADSLDVAKVEKKAKKSNKDFFVEYRVERDQARSEQINLLREMINNPNSDKELKAQAQKLLLQITNNIEKEMEIESLIRARGYEDGIAFIHDDSVELVIASTGLQRDDVAKIGDIIVNSTGVSLQDITIIEKKPE
ncbi:SpoIIIAH-like family protein [Halanaerocella petrolearia]